MILAGFRRHFGALTLAGALTFFAVLPGCHEAPVTGNESLILVSEGQMERLGDQAFLQVMGEVPRVRSEAWRETVNTVAERVLGAAEQDPDEWDVRVFDKPDRNAFALPGKHIGVFAGMMEEFDNEAELAAVLGHEVGHVLARHAGQRITVTLGERLGFAALQSILAGEDRQLRSLLIGALGLGAQLGITLPFSRAHESEADHIGLVYMARAGYAPQAAVDFWEEFGRNSGEGPPEFLSTHPSAGTRIHQLQTWMEEAQIAYQNSPQYGKGRPIPPR